MMKERNYGIDIFRIMCCIGVLDYHIMDDIVFGIGGRMSHPLYFLASFCVPGFFLLSGYLLGARDDLSLLYIENKVSDIMAKLFGWIVFWVSVHYIRTGELYELWINFTAGVGSGGILPVAWFLFTYCLLLIIGYPLYYFYHKHSYIFSALLILWMAALALGAGEDIITTRGQSLWLHLYLGYFCVGIAMNRIRVKLSRWGGVKLQVVILLCINMCCLLVYAYKIVNTEVYYPPHSYYGKWFYTIWIVSLFLLVSMIKVQNKAKQKIIQRMASNTFVVYLGHLPVLLYITDLWPLQSTMMAVVFILVFFLGLQLVAEVFRRLPLFRKLV